MKKIKLLILTVVVFLTLLPATTYAGLLAGQNLQMRYIAFGQ